MVLWKKLWHYTKNYGTLIYYGKILVQWKKNYDTIVNQSKLQFTIVFFACLEKLIPYLKMARFSFCFVLRVSTLKDKCCANDVSLLICIFQVVEQEKSRIVVVLCTCMHMFCIFWNNEQDLRSKYKLKRNLLNFNVKINMYSMSSIALHQCILQYEKSVYFITAG